MLQGCVLRAYESHVESFVTKNTPHRMFHLEKNEKNQLHSKAKGKEKLKEYGILTK